MDYVGPTSFSPSPGIDRSINTRFLIGRFFRGSGGLVITICVPIGRNDGSFSHCCERVDVADLVRWLDHRNIEGAVEGIGKKQKD